MAVLISDANNPAYDSLLTTANGLYTVSAHNLGYISNTNLALSTSRIIPITFAHAANVLGFGIALSTTTVIDNIRPLTVSFQENVSGTWTTRQTRSLTTADIINGLNPAGTWVLPFDFGTPYAIDTASNKWRLVVVSSVGVQNVHWQLCTSNGVNPFFFAWVDVQATAISGSDAIVVKDKLKFNTSFELKSVAITGVATAGVCCVVCRETDPTPAVIGNFEVDDFSSAITIGVDGILTLSTHAGIRIGSDVNRPSASLPFTFVTRAATIGSTPGVIYSTGGTSRTGTTQGRSSFFAYGERAPKCMARTTVAASVGATTITLDDASWLNVDDHIAIGRRSSRASLDQGQPRHVVTSIVGNDVTFSPALLSYQAVPGAWVVRERNATTGYYQGVILNINFAVSGMWSNFVLDGAVSTLYRTFIGHNNQGNVEETAYTVGYIFKHFISISSSAGNGYGQSHVNWMAGFMPCNTGIEMEHCYGLGCNFFGGFVNNQPANGAGGLQYVPNFLKMTDVYNSRASSNNPLLGIPSSVTATLNRVVWDGLGAGTTRVALGGSPLSTGNDLWVWGANTSTTISAVICYSMRTNRLNVGCCNTGITFSGGIHTDLTLGEHIANTYDFVFPGFSSYRGSFRGITGNPTYDNLYLQSTLPTSRATFTDVNTPGNDYTIAPEGYTYVTGAGLADTTARTAGGKAIRFQSIRADLPLEWTAAIPTGNIQSKTMTAGVWMKINSANYWSGSHQMPRLMVSYDNDASSVYAEALPTTDWQFVVVPFTPATTFGQVTLTFSTMTDATTSDAYVYMDDFSAPLPQGSELNLGTFDLTSDALPVSPLNFATAVTAADVWAADPTLFGAGTVGERVNKIKTIVTSLQ